MPELGTAAAAAGPVDGRLRTGACWAGAPGGDRMGCGYPQLARGDRRVHGHAGRQGQGHPTITPGGPQRLG